MPPTVNVSMGSVMTELPAPESVSATPGTMALFAQMSALVALTMFVPATVFVTPEQPALGSAPASTMGSLELPANDVQLITLEKTARTALIVSPGSVMMVWLEMAPAFATMAGKALSVRCASLDDTVLPVSSVPLVSLVLAVRALMVPESAFVTRASTESSVQNVRPTDLAPLVNSVFATTVFVMTVCLVLGSAFVQLDSSDRLVMEFAQVESTIFALVTALATTRQLETAHVSAMKASMGWTVPSVVRTSGVRLAVATALPVLSEALAPLALTGMGHASVMLDGTECFVTLVYPVSLVPTVSFAFPGASGRTAKSAAVSTEIVMTPSLERESVTVILSGTGRPVKSNASVKTEASAMTALMAMDLVSVSQASGAPTASLTVPLDAEPLVVSKLLEIAHVIRDTMALTAPLSVQEESETSVMVLVSATTVLWALVLVTAIPGSGPRTAP